MGPCGTEVYQKKRRSKELPAIPTWTCPHCGAHPYACQLAANGQRSFAMAPRAKRPLGSMKRIREPEDLVAKGEQTAHTYVNGCSRSLTALR